METSDITLTFSQSNVIEKLEDFVNQHDKRVFLLKGYAGTGKTTLMKVFINWLQKQDKPFRLLAATGRAAKVLKNALNGEFETSTVHSMFYKFGGFNMDLSNAKEIKEGNGKSLFFCFEPSKVDSAAYPKPVTYIIDEASMISDVEPQTISQAKFGTGKLLTELLNYDDREGSKFVFIGDPCQLPPIEQYFSPALSVPYFQEHFNIEPIETQLTQIMRQENGSTIIKASKEIRTLYESAPADKTKYGRQHVWGMLHFKNYRDIILHRDMEDLISDYIGRIRDCHYDRAVCICRSNNKCQEVSESIKSKLGFSQSLQAGDILQVVQNNYPCQLMNGDMVEVVSVGNERTEMAGLHFIRVKVKELVTGRVSSSLLIEELLYQSRPNLDSSQQNKVFVNFVIRMRRQGINQKSKTFAQELLTDSYINALRCSFGYAITCHKAQGGEWDDVYLVLPRNITLNPTKETYQWLYTAMTRARKRIHVIDDFYIK